MSSRVAVPSSFGRPAKGVYQEDSAEIVARADAQRLGDGLKCRSTVIRYADGALSRSETVVPPSLPAFPTLKR